MSRRLPGVTGLAIVASLALTATAGANGPTADPLQLMVRQGSMIPGQVIVRFASDASAKERRSIRAANDATVKRTLPMPGVQLLEIDADKSVTAVAEAFEQSDEVVYAEPNYRVRATSTTPNDPSFGSLWGLHNTGQYVNNAAGSNDADIDAPEAWDIATGTNAMTVAVVDSGVAYDHPDLAPNIWTNSGETGSGRESDGVDNDGNGFVDDWRGWDFVGSDNNPRDLHGHGTHVAGTIAARGNNGAGVTGVSWQARIMPLRALGANGSGSTAAIAAAFSYAAANGANIVNASLGGPDFSQALSDAITGNPNTLFVVAAGNSATNNETVPEYPCNYTAANLICVAASDQNDLPASFTNYGTNSVDLAAPGTNIYSARPAYDTLWSDGFETDIAGRWTTGGSPDTWGRTNAVFRSGNYSLSDGPGDYANDTVNWARTTNPVSLAGRTGCRVDAFGRVNTEPGFDFLYIQRSADASTWTTTSTWSGLYGSTFYAASDDLSPLDGGNAFVRFLLVTDAGTTADGVYVDDVLFKCLSDTYDGSELAFKNGTSMATPVVAGAAAVVWSKYPSLTVAQLRSAILTSVDMPGGLAGLTATGGRLNLHKALLKAAEILNPPSPPPSPPSQPPAPSPAPTPGGGTAGGGGGTGGGDTTPPSTVVTTPVRQNPLSQGGITFGVKCSEPCTVTVSIVFVGVPGLKRIYGTYDEATTSVSLIVELTKRQRRAILKAIRRASRQGKARSRRNARRKPRATLRVVTRDASGNSSATVTKRVTLVAR